MNQKLDSATITFASRNLPGFGSEYELIGTVLSMKPGEVSKPIKGNSAVFVVKLTSITDATPIEDYKATADMLERRFTSRVGNSYMNVLKEDAKIKDNRLLIY